MMEKHILIVDLQLVFQLLFSWLFRTSKYTQGRKKARWWRSFPSNAGKKGTTSSIFRVWVPVKTVVPLLSIPFIASSHFKIKYHPNPISEGSAFYCSVSLCLKSVTISPVKSPRGHVDMPSSRWGDPVHTQVPWWCTVCLRCLRPKPRSLKSTTRCCDVSTRALAIAIPISPETKRELTEKYITCCFRCICIQSSAKCLNLTTGGLLRWHFGHSPT